MRNTGCDNPTRDNGATPPRFDIGHGTSIHGIALNAVGFQGLGHDEGLDAIDNRARVYLPPLGRFAQTDPLGYPDGLNTYAAYHVMWGGWDPSGMGWFDSLVTAALTGRWVDPSLNDGVAGQIAGGAVEGAGQGVRDLPKRARNIKDGISAAAEEVVFAGALHVGAMTDKQYLAQSQLAQYVYEGTLSGMTPEEIRQAMVDAYGDQLLAMLEELYDKAERAACGDLYAAGDLSRDVFEVAAAALLAKGLKGRPGRVTTPKDAPKNVVGSGGTANSAQYAKLKEFYRQAEKYGADGSRLLENGRYRFYGEFRPASTPGEMAGARLVREWDPASGATRTWMETLDQAGTVRSVAPKPPIYEQNHFIFDAAGNYVGRR